MWIFQQLVFENDFEFLQHNLGKNVKKDMINFKHEDISSKTHLLMNIIKDDTFLV